MAIVFLTNYLTPYQAALFSSGGSNVIITYSVVDAKRQWAPLKVETPVKDISGLRLGRRLRKIYCEINGSFEGILIGGSVRSPEFWFSIVLSRRRGTPFAIWMERPRAPISRLRGRLLRIALGKTGVILAVGTIATISYRMYIPGVKVRSFPYSYGRNAPNGAGPTDTKNGKNGETLTALFIGNEWKRKGLDILLVAAAKMPDELQPQLALRVVGLTEPPAELAGIVGAHQGSASYLGFLEPHDVRKELGAADVLVVPSRCDGWAVVVEEAMAEGTPVIASDEVGAAADLVVNGYSGFTFPSEDIEALAATLTGVMRHDVAIQTLSAGALAIIAEHHDKYNMESLERAVCRAARIRSQRLGLGHPYGDL
jgi:glycosyltransferase involved in cell wall biosynthesis